MATAKWPTPLPMTPVYQKAHPKEPMACAISQQIYELSVF
jgi:hypothetical protein